MSRTPTLVRTHPSEESFEEPAWGKLPPNVYYLLPENTDARNSHEADSVSSHKRRFGFAQTRPIRQNRSNARWSEQGKTREVLIKTIHTRQTRRVRTRVDSKSRVLKPLGRTEAMPDGRSKSKGVHSRQTQRVRTSTDMAPRYAPHNHETHNEGCFARSRVPESMLVFVNVSRPLHHSAQGMHPDVIRCRSSST